MSKSKQIELYSPQYYMACGIGGIMSCGLTHTAITPLDLVKCRVQTSGGSYGQVYKGIVEQRGIRGLGLGWAPTAVGYSLQGLFKFGLYEVFKKKYSDMVGEENAEKYRTLIFLAGSASAEFFADIALCPWEAVKVRMQTNVGFANTMREALPKIYKAEGLGGLYKGLTPLWFRQIPYTMMKFAAFERTVEAIYKYGMSKPKSEYSKNVQLGISFLGGYIAGVFCAVVSHPADVVVSKLNNVKSEGTSTGTAIVQILKEAGPMGVWKGLGARIIMIGTLTGLQWGIYDAYKVASGFPTTGSSGGKK